VATSSSAAAPSARASVKANPELVVASASKAEHLERPRRPRVPGVRDHERLALVERLKRGSPLLLRRLYATIIPEAAAFPAVH
jgi:hypothetical protein